MRIFRERKTFVLEQSELTPALASLTPDRRVRQKIWNWKPAHWNEDGSSEHFNMRSEVEHYFKQHEGEARVWQTEPEQWLPLVTRDYGQRRRDGQPAATEGLTNPELGENDMGIEYDGTTIGVTHADRAREFYKSQSGFRTQRRLVTEFGPTQKSDDLDDNLQPDINSAVSTLVVRGKKGSEVLYWLCQVRVISLPEEYASFQHDLFFCSYLRRLAGGCVRHQESPSTRRGWIGIFLGQRGPVASGMASPRLAGVAASALRLLLGAPYLAASQRRPAARPASGGTASQRRPDFRSWAAH